MPTLTISDFSCIKEAHFELSPVNVIIGPQGSGKSITTKLLYFLADILNNFTQCSEQGISIDDYKKSISKLFCLWFPPQAWGGGRFNINYTTGEFTVRVLRRQRQGKVTDDVAITFSDWFMVTYSKSKELFESSTDKDFDIEENVQVSDAIDRSYRVRDLVYRRLTKDIGGEFFSQQTFIPAGRAFFTSIGRLVAGFEQAGSLDPVTVKFARLFANIRDRYGRRLPSRIERLGVDFNERRSRFMGELFGGELKYKDDTEFVETSDGRKVPFSSLSSGQQELLPMWSLMDYFNEMDALRVINRASGSKNRHLVYIEEPEAHLFPSAQSKLMEFLIGSLASEKNRRNLIITTHSPYIMSKLNLFLKAGLMSKRKKRNEDIHDVVGRECWLREGSLSAYAIENGILKSLMDDDGLIDGRYLDGISEELSQQYSELLQIESEI